MINKVFKVSIVVLGLDIVSVILPILIVIFFPGGIFSKVVWILSMRGLLALPFTFSFFLISFCIYNKKNKSMEKDLASLKKDSLDLD